MFGRWRKQESPEPSSALDRHVDAYIRAVRAAHDMGGFPLVALVLGVILVPTTLLLQATLTNVFPALLALSVILSVMGAVLYVLESYWRRRAVERSLERYHRHVDTVLGKYFEGKYAVSDFELQALLKEVAEVVLRAPQVAAPPR